MNWEDVISLIGVELPESKQVIGDEIMSETKDVKPQTEVKDETEKEEISVAELVEKIKNLSNEVEGIKKSSEDLHGIYEEMINNMKEQAKEEKVENPEFPTFEQWLKDLYEQAKEQAEKKKKYPYYPYYPYPHYYGYPKPRKESEEEEAKKETPQGEAVVQEDASIRLKEKLFESLRKYEPIKEQWTTPIVRADQEIVGNVRDFVKVDRLLEDKPGDTVNVACVEDFDFGTWGTYGTATLGDYTASPVVSYASATVQEAGMKFYLEKKDIEKADSNIVELINERARIAALRAEDKKVLADIYGTAGVLSIDKSGSGTVFDADWIAEIVSAFQNAGVQVDPGQIVLFIEPAMHEALLKDIAGAMSLTFARPDIVQKGMLTEFMGVTIRIVSHSILPNDGTNTYAIAFIKGSYVLAPKRNVYIETQPDAAARKTLMVITSAAAGILPSPKNGLKLKTTIAP